MEKRLSIPETTKLERVVTALLGITVLDTAYLSWRYLSLHAGTVIPGTGLCSWTEGIDCDVVLQTPQARALWVPNAVLGFGFYFGCFLWWTLGRRYFPQLKRHVLTTLTFWLAVAAIVTLWFFNLLMRLPALCPFCPWNHVLSWVALFFVWKIRSQTPRDSRKAKTNSLIPLIAFCVGQLLMWLTLWFIAFNRGVFTP